MPGVVDRMELSKVFMVADDDSTDSLDTTRYSEPADVEKTTINRSAALVYHWLYLRNQPPPPRPKLWPRPQSWPRPYASALAPLLTHA